MRSIRCIQLPIATSSKFNLRWEHSSSLFHRRPLIPYSCGDGNWRAWADLVGNWLREGNLGEQTGFVSGNKGVAVGVDKKLGQHWAFGGGFIWNLTDMMMHLSRGTGTVNRFLAALNADFNSECFYCGFSLYGGLDANNAIRHIVYPSTDLSAKGEFSSIHIGGQFDAAYIFGFPYCLLYPYAELDYFYFRGKGFTETGADGLNLSIKPHSSQTLRSSAGIGVFTVDCNLSETICVVPTIAFGWTMECPIHRPSYTAHFSGETLSFAAEGWNHTWQAFSSGLWISRSISMILSSLENTFLSPLPPPWLIIGPSDAVPLFNTPGNTSGNTPW